MNDVSKPINVAVTPLGFISFPNLAKPDTGRPNSSGKFGAQIFISKEVFRTEGMDLVQKVLEQGRKLLGGSVKADGTPVTLRDFKHTIKDVDTFTPEKKAKLHESVRSGFIQINCASTRAPVVKDAKQNLLPLADIERIQGGDICRFVVAAYTYKQQGGGVALGLNVVQFKERGPNQFGGGGSGVELLSDLEVKMETPIEALGATHVAAPAVKTEPVVPASPMDSLGF